MLRTGRFGHFVNSPTGIAVAALCPDSATPAGLGKGKADDA